MGDDYVLRSPTVADAARLAEVHLRSWQTAYRGIFPQHWLDDWRSRLARRTTTWAGVLAQPDPPGSATIVVETSAGEMAGFAGGGPRRDDGIGHHRGELYGIYLLAEHRGRGQGARLLRWTADHLRRLGFADMMLWVVASNPSCGFYAAMGGVVIPGLTKEVEIAGVGAREIAYGWDRLPEAEPLGR
jgi:GNAT superfamily N-acetyltransferase